MVLKYVIIINMFTLLRRRIPIFTRNINSIPPKLLTPDSVTIPPKSIPLVTKLRPTHVIAEVSYRCPLSCPYCSNPTNLSKRKSEVDTDTYKRVIRETAEMGAVQIGFSGGEPLVRDDLEELVGEASSAGMYTNLITSGIGLSEDRMYSLKQAGLDSVQISFQADDRTLNNFIGKAGSFDKKIKAVENVHSHGLPLTVNVVLHRLNIDRITTIMEMCSWMKADYVELANVQWYGWSKLNFDKLMPTSDQLKRAYSEFQEYVSSHPDGATFFYVIPDYADKYPKACFCGWGQKYICVTPDGNVLPCLSAEVFSDKFEIPTVETNIAETWEKSELFNAFRGRGWMKDPCRSCPKAPDDLGGCRCQAYMLTGDPYATDPVCVLSPHHQIIKDMMKATPSTDSKMIFRSRRKSYE